MKTYCRYALVLSLAAVLLGCQQEQRRPLTETQSETISQQVKRQFDRLIAAVNEKDAEAWARFYSEDAFISALAGTERYDTRDAWVGAITKHFSQRERQTIEPVQVRVTALSHNLALMASEEKTEVWLESGEHAAEMHVFTMLWRKEPAGWKILHSHESYE